ncbi:MAG: transcription antitermination factor NusB [Betaproteobacteria bacterium]
MNTPVKSPKPPAKSPRRRAREFALQGLYQWRLGSNDRTAIEKHLAEMEGYAKADGEFCLALVRGVMANHEELAGLFASHLDRRFDELSPIEGCVLLLGAFELTRYPETPYRVIINESIELTKSFGGSDGHKYVNGVLDKLAATVRATEVEARRKKE